MATPHTPETAASDGTLHDCANAIMERAGAHLSDLDCGERFHVTVTLPRLVHIDRYIGADGSAEAASTILVGTIALDDTRDLDDVDPNNVHIGTDMAGRALPVAADAAVESVVAAAMAVAVDMVNVHLKTAGIDATVDHWNPQGGDATTGGMGDDAVVDDGDA